MGEYSLLILVGFPLLMIGIQVLLFVAPGGVGEPERDPEHDR